MTCVSSQRATEQAAVEVSISNIQDMCVNARIKSVKKAGEHTPNKASPKPLPRTKDGAKIVNPAQTSEQNGEKCTAEEGKCHAQETSDKKIPSRGIARKGEKQAASGKEDFLQEISKRLYSEAIYPITLPLSQ